MPSGSPGSWKRGPVIIEKQPLARGFPSASQSYAIIDGSWKLIYNKVPVPGRAEYELFEFPKDRLDQKNVAGEHQISRTDQDAFAYRSQRRCKAAQDRGFFDKEIVKVCVKKGKTEAIVDKDEHPRGDTTMETLSKLPAAFREGGSVTAGNSSGINDGACAMIVASEAAAKAKGLRVVYQPIVDLKAANVEANGTQPRTCMPTAAATICCSAMNISK